MAVRCRIASGYSPNYCALSPNAIRAIAKTKAEDGHYLFPNFKAGDVIPGTNMVAIEDQNMTITTVIPDPDEEGPEEETTKTTEAAMVYFNGVITYKVADPDQVEIGLTDKQSSTTPTPCSAKVLAFSASITLLLSATAQTSVSRFRASKE